MSFDPITAALDLGGKLIDKLFPDPAQRDAAKIKLMEMQQQGELSKLMAETDIAKTQAAINQIEAGSSDRFTSRARPFILWICGIAFAYSFVLQPFMIFITVVFNSKFDYKLLPELDWTILMPILGGILGLGGFRTFEKVKGVAK